MTRQQVVFRKGGQEVGWWWCWGGLGVGEARGVGGVSLRGRETVSVCLRVLNRTSRYSAHFVCIEIKVSGD